MCSQDFPAPSQFRAKYKWKGGPFGVCRNWSLQDHSPGLNDTDRKGPEQLQISPDQSGPLPTYPRKTLDLYNMNEIQKFLSTSVSHISINPLHRKISHTNQESGFYVLRTSYNWALRTLPSQNRTFNWLCKSQTIGKQSLHTYWIACA